VSGVRLSPHPVEHLAMLADPPPPGEGKSRNVESLTNAAGIFMSTTCMRVVGN
jgi:hypothetical protein